LCGPVTLCCVVLLHYVVWSCYIMLCGPVTLCLLHHDTESVQAIEGCKYFPRGPYVGQPCRGTCKLRSRSAKCPPPCGKLFIVIFTLLRFLPFHIFVRCFSEVTLISSSHSLRLCGCSSLCISPFLPACYILCYPVIFFVNVLITHFCLSPCCIPVEVRMF